MTITNLSEEDANINTPMDNQIGVEDMNNEDNLVVNDDDSPQVKVDHIEVEGIGDDGEDGLAAVFEDNIVSEEDDILTLRMKMTMMKVKRKVTRQMKKMRLSMMQL